MKKPKTIIVMTLAVLILLFAYTVNNVTAETLQEDINFIETADSITNIGLAYTGSSNNNAVSEEIAGLASEYVTVYDDNWGALDFGIFRPNFQSLPIHFVDLVGEEVFREWEDSRLDSKSLEEIYSESIAVSFIRYFNISREDFTRANEKWYQSVINRGLSPLGSSAFELFPVDLIFTFDNELINKYFLWENSPIAEEFGMGMERGQHRRLHYNMPAPFAELVGRMTFIQWKHARSQEERANENIAVSFIREFNISKEDFTRANEEMRRVWSRYHFTNTNFELYPVDLIFTFDNELINEYFLWENSPIDWERELWAANPTEGITNVAINITAPVAGAVPSTTATGAGNFTIGEVTWSQNDTAMVTLRANRGYTFARLTNATINGNAATIVTNTGSRIILSYQFTPNDSASIITQTVQIRIDGEFVQIPAGEQQPIIVNGRTLVPFRAVMEALGFEVDWEPAPQNRATLAKPGYDVSVTIGSNIMIVNENNISLDVPAQLINARTMVPLRAISEATGMEVRWDRENFIVNILTSDDLRPEPITDANWPEHLPRHIPGTITLHPQYVLTDMTMQSRFAFYSLPGVILTLVSNEEANHWSQNIRSNESIETSIVMSFVQYFDIPREDFEDAIERLREVRISFGSDLTDEYFELPNADIIYTFDNDIIRYFYRRE